MFKKILDKIFYKRRYLNALVEIDKWKALYSEVRRKSTPEVVVENVMRRGIDWYDYEEITDINQRRGYYNDAQLVLNNDTFKNEIKHLLADQVEFIARESSSHEETMNIRMTINAIDLIKERLESIGDPDKDNPSTDNLYSAI